jgi:hypothetical protein
VTVGCPADVGGFEFVDVIPLGSIAFVLDAEGEATGEKYVVHSLDVAAFTDGGDLVFEFHKVYGQRKGHGEPFSCSGSFPVEPGVTAFFDVLVTRR